MEILIRNEHPELDVSIQYAIHKHKRMLNDLNIHASAAPEVLFFEIMNVPCEYGHIQPLDKGIYRIYINLHQCVIDDVPVEAAILHELTHTVVPDGRIQPILFHNEKLFGEIRSYYQDNWNISI